MTTTTTKHKVNGQSIWISADFTRANSPIYVAFDNPSDDERNWQNTGMQVADARHNADRAAELAAEWGANQ